MLGQALKAVTDKGDQRQLDLPLPLPLPGCYFCRLIIRYGGTGLMTDKQARLLRQKRMEGKTNRRRQSWPG